jgi:type IV secretion system protein TrbL
MAGCDLPGVGAVCDTVSGAVGDLAGEAAGSVFDAAAQKIAEGFATATQMVVTFWTGVDVPGLSAGSGPVAELRGNTAWLTAWIAVLSVLVCAGRLALTRSSRPAGEAFKGLLILVVVSGCGVAAVNALVVFGDEYSRWVLDRSTDGQLGARMASLATLGGVPGLGSGLLLLVGLLGMLASLVQMGLMLVRVGVITIFAGLLPLAAAGTGTETGMAWFKRITSWLLAFILYKPAAATVYASAFLLIGDGTDATSVLSGLFMLILSIVALPSLLRLITPMVGAAVAAGAGAGGGAAAAGMVLASGARMTAGGGRGAMPPMPPSAGGSAGLLGPGGAGPSGSPGPRGGAGPAGPGAGGGAASAGMAGAGLQAGVQLATSTASAARGAVPTSAAGSNGGTAANTQAPPSGAAR